MQIRVRFYTVDVRDAGFVVAGELVTGGGAELEDCAVGGGEEGGEDGGEFVCGEGFS